MKKQRSTKGRKNNANTIPWFKSIPDKKASSFVNFNVKNFYPSFLEKLSADAISYAKSSSRDMTKKEYSVITHSRKILLFQNSEQWVKKHGNDNFDVSMECYDRARICELVGSFILNQLGLVIEKNVIGLNRDDEFFAELQNQWWKERKK